MGRPGEISAAHFLRLQVHNSSMTASRYALAILFVVAGILHFVITPVYLKIMPPYLPSPRLLVQISGVAEILGGLGLLFAGSRSLAAWGLIALLVAVTPANVQMALDHARWSNIPVWALWLRVPMQLPLIWWAWLYTRT
jgi:uncharacterized membrane protein